MSKPLQEQPGKKYWNKWYAFVLLALIAQIILYSYLTYYYHEQH